MGLGLYVAAHIAQEEKLQPGTTTRSMAGANCSHSVLVSNISSQQSVSRLNLPTVTPTAPPPRPLFPNPNGLQLQKITSGGRFSVTVYLHSMKQSQTRRKLLIRILIRLQNRLQQQQQQQHICNLYF